MASPPPEGERQMTKLPLPWLHSNTAEEKSTEACFALILPSRRDHLSSFLLCRAEWFTRDGIFPSANCPRLLDAGLPGLAADVCDANNPTQPPSL
mmetsp:Transcript_36886/g.105693  ORF Transcript_36886/g.105693 Transcript_36886/m.105693 type:complete len:95 (-) Transcript_36886:9-293(-)